MLTCERLEDATEGTTSEKLEELLEDVQIACHAHMTVSLRQIASAIWTFDGIQLLTIARCAQQ